MGEGGRTPHFYVCLSRRRNSGGSRGRRGRRQHKIGWSQGGSGLPHAQLSRQGPEGTGALPQNQFLEVALNESGNPRSGLQDAGMRGCEGHPHAPPPEGAFWAPMRLAKTQSPPPSPHLGGSSSPAATPQGAEDSSSLSQWGGGREQGREELERRYSWSLGVWGVWWVRGVQSVLQGRCPLRPFPESLYAQIPVLGSPSCLPRRGRYCTYSSTCLSLFAFQLRPPSHSREPGRVREQRGTGLTAGHLGRGLKVRQKIKDGACVVLQGAEKGQPWPGGGRVTLGGVAMQGTLRLPPPQANVKLGPWKVHRQSRGLWDHENPPFPPRSRMAVV